MACVGGGQQEEQQPPLGAPPFPPYKDFNLQDCINHLFRPDSPPEGGGDAEKPFKQYDLAAYAYNPFGDPPSPHDSANKSPLLDSHQREASSPMHISPHTANSAPSLVAMPKGHVRVPLVTSPLFLRAVAPSGYMERALAKTQSQNKDLEGTVERLRMLSSEQQDEVEKLQDDEKEQRDTVEKLQDMVHELHGIAGECKAALETCKGALAEALQREEVAGRVARAQDAAAAAAAAAACAQSVALEECRAKLAAALRREEAAERTQDGDAAARFVKVRIVKRVAKRQGLTVERLLEARGLWHGEGGEKFQGEVRDAAGADFKDFDECARACARSEDVYAAFVVAL